MIKTNSLAKIFIFLGVLIIFSTHFHYSAAAAEKGVVATISSAGENADFKVNNKKAETGIQLNNGDLIEISNGFLVILYNNGTKLKLLTGKRIPTKYIVSLNSIYTDIGIIKVEEIIGEFKVNTDKDSIIVKEKGEIKVAEDGMIKETEKIEKIAPEPEELDQGPERIEGSRFNP